MIDSRALLDSLHQIEAAFGRVRTTRWGPRSLDLDLLAAGDQIAPDLATWTHWRDLPLDDQLREAPTQMILPHPRIQDRSFVLVPLMDVAPNWVHPVSGQTVRQMYQACDRDDLASVVPLDGVANRLVNNDL